MDIKKVKDEGASKEFFVSLSPGEIESQIEEVLKKRAKTMKLDGFRPGKVPFEIVRKYYEDAARSQVLSDSVQEAYKKVSKEEKIRPLLDPTYRIDEGYEKGKEFSFSLTAYPYPEITLKDFKEISLEKLKVEFPDSVVESRLKKIAEQYVGYEAQDSSYAAQMEDKVIIDLESHHGKKRLKNYTGKEIAITLKSEENFLSFLHEHLKGVQKGQKLDFTHAFSADEKDKDLSGNTISFSIKVHRVESPHKYEVGDQLAQKLGHENLEKFREFIRNTIQNEHDNVARLYHKRHLLDALSDHYPFPVPQVLIDREFGAIWYRLQEEMAKDEEKPEKTEEELREDCKKLADRRVRLGLLISEISRVHNIRVTEEMLRRRLISEMFQNPRYAAEISEYYRRNPEAVEQIRSSILEDLIVDFILSQVSFSEVSVSPEALKEKMQDILPGFGEEALPVEEELSSESAHETL